MGPHHPDHPDPKYLNVYQLPNQRYTSTSHLSNVPLPLQNIRHLGVEATEAGPRCRVQGDGGLQQGSAAAAAIAGHAGIRLALVVSRRVSVMVMVVMLVQGELLSSG